MILSQSYPNQYTYTYLTFVVISGIYYAIFSSMLFGGPNINTAEGLIIQATAQKIVVYALIICLLIQSYGAWKQVKLKPLRKSFFSILNL